MGATPTSAAIFLRSILPSSGRSASSVAVVTIPTPGALLRICACSCHAFCSFRNSWICSSKRFFSSFRRAMIRSTEPRKLGEMVRKRFCSAFSISSSCSRLTSRALNCFSASLLPSYRLGCIFLPNSANTCASSLSVLASRPLALANCLTRAGFTTATAGFHHNEFWLQCLHLFQQLSNSIFRIANLLALSFPQYSYIQSFLCHINPYIRFTTSCHLVLLFL